MRARDLRGTSLRWLLMGAGLAAMAAFAAALAIAQAPAAQAQAAKASQQKPRIIYWVPKPHFTAAQMARIHAGGSNANTIPLWNFTTVAYDGNTYSGDMVGRSPFAHGHKSTTIPTFVVPIILVIPKSGGGTVTYDPTALDACAPKGTSVDTQLLQSPIFQLVGPSNPSDFNMNGVDVGPAQYLDAFQRANFWTLVGGTPYHTVFTTNPTVLPAITVNVPAASGQISNFGNCEREGLMDINFWIPEAENLINTTLAGEGVGPTTFPQFLFDSVAMYDTNPGNCCILGFHDAFGVGPGNSILQTFSTNDYSVSGAFGNGNTGVLSHEVAEWMDDPAGGNPVPSWGGEGQVPNPNCQGNLEVGDPLSPGFGTPSSPFTVTMPNGTAYTLQELAFYSWFLGDAPQSRGAGGKFSDNGTFGGHAKEPCPPGGTN